MYLLDTNVLSELRKRSRCNDNVKRWAQKVSIAEQYLSVVSIFEIQRGILQLHQKSKADAEILQDWLSRLILPMFHILPIDTAVAIRCASLQVPNPCSFCDSLIAATAMVHNLTVVTRNTKDFTATGVRLLNPWDG